MRLNLSPLLLSHFLHLSRACRQEEVLGSRSQLSLPCDIGGRLVFLDQNLITKMMFSGENTLEVQLGRRLLTTMSLHGGQFDKHAWLQEFDRFMTTPGSHNDVYASTYIRMFFANKVKGQPLEACADNDGHNTDAIDAMTLVGPVALSSLKSSDSKFQSVCDFISSTRNSPLLLEFAKLYAGMVQEILEAQGDPADILRTAAEKAGRQLGVNVKAISASSRADPMTACYIESSFPAMLIFLYKYADDPLECLLKSVNAGGENVARTACLGFLVGAAYGDQAWEKHPWLFAELKDSESISNEIDSFLSSM